METMTIPDYLTATFGDDPADFPELLFRTLAGVLDLNEEYDAEKQWPCDVLSRATRATLDETKRRNTLLKEVMDAPAGMKAMTITQFAWAASEKPFTEIYRNPFLGAHLEAPILHQLKRRYGLTGEYDPSQKWDAEDLIMAYKTIASTTGWTPA